LKYILSFSIPFIITFIFKNMFFNILNKPVCLRENYKKNLIPVCGGLIFIPLLLISTAILSLFKYQPESSLLFLLAVTVMSYAGLIDDLIGDRSVTGLKGHFKMILNGNLTTGGLKAILGLVIALIVSYILSSNYINILINTIIISLFTNLLNLTDLRPGRASKTFIFFSIIFLIIGKGNPTFLLMVTAILLVYFPSDLKGNIMMGDTGSNVLGITLGITSILVLNFNLRVALLVLLIAIHFITEKYSLTKIIEKTAVLNYLDMLGRK